MPAHHHDDAGQGAQAHLRGGSGVDGLAAMPAVTETPNLRLLRPLLGVPRARLEATLRRRDLGWIEDPSNRDRAHARVRLRALQPMLTDEGLSPRRLAATAARLGRARAALERATAEVLAHAASVHPAG
ncbi:MAG TPA: ATP-binding protein, partial [Kiloniellales bacterium]